MSEEGRLARESQDSLLHHSALNIIILNHHILLQDLHGVQLICAFTLCQHDLKMEHTKINNQTQLCTC